jgi:hypothetical protein
MLPNFARLSLKPTGLFYSLTQPEADALNANNGKDPISLEKYKANQHRDSDEATFRVRVTLSNNQSAYKTYIAEGLWNWVRRPGPNTNPPVATVPETRQPIWREDWWELSDRFAPGVPYPRWVRNLPLSDPSVPDTKTYAAAAQPAPIVWGGGDEWAEGNNLVGDVNEFVNRASNWEAGQNTLMHTNIVRGALETLLRGVDEFNYDDRLDHPDFSMLAIALANKLLMLLASGAPENPVRALADAQVKGYALALLASLAHNRAFQPLIRAAPNLLAHLNTFQDTVLDNDDFNWGIEPNDFGWFNVEARLTRWRHALRVVKHAYWWDSRVGRLLLMPAPGEMTLRALNRPLTVAEIRALDDLAITQVGVERAVAALEQYGARQFFATNGGGACFQLLTDLKNGFVAADAFPNSITMRNLALTQFAVVINAYAILERDASWRQDHETAARALMRAFNQSLEAAATTGRINRTLRPTTEDIGTYIEEFFWRVAAPRYVEQAAGSFVSTRAVERTFYSLVLLPNWPNRPPLDGDEAEESEEEDEYSDGEVVPDDEPIPDYLLEEADEEEEAAGPRPGTPMPPSPAPAPRYNLRSRRSRSGETPDARRQRR